jgi:hypothetical protein
MNVFSSPQERRCIPPTLTLLNKNIALIMKNSEAQMPNECQIAKHQSQKTTLESVRKGREFFDILALSLI